MDKNYYLNIFPGVCELLASFTADFTGQGASPESVAEELELIVNDLETFSDDDVLTAYVEKHLGYIA